MPTTNQTDFSGRPDSQGHFGRYGGMFVAETLMGPLQELREAYENMWADLRPSIMPDS